MKEQKQESIVQYLEALSSKSPIPGGGGAAALSAAFAFSLGMMVGNLTLGKKSYADFQNELEEIMKSLEQGMKRFSCLCQRHIPYPEKQRKNKRFTGKPWRTVL